MKLCPHCQREIILTCLFCRATRALRTNDARYPYKGTRAGKKPAYITTKARKEANEVIQ